MAGAVVAIDAVRFMDPWGRAEGGVGLRVLLALPMEIPTIFLSNSARQDERV